MYKITSPKLKTSDLKTLEDIILFDLVFTSSGARNGTVPKTVASSTDSLSIILVLPTSQIFKDNCFVLRISIFYGFISQWAILFFYK
jgi:hypothetical protein